MAQVGESKADLNDRLWVKVITPGGNRSDACLFGADFSGLDGGDEADGSSAVAAAPAQSWTFAGHRSRPWHARCPASAAMPERSRTAP